MATLVNRPNGFKSIQFTNSSGKRPELRLGKASKKQGETFLTKIDAILSDLALKRPHDVEVSNWIKSLPPIILKRMQSMGLAGTDVGSMDSSIKDFMERFFAALTCKESARTFYGHTRRCLESFLGENRAMRLVTTSDADAWKAWLVSNEKLASATVSRRIIAARTMWKKAIRWKLVAENPFAGVRAGNQQNESRKFFVKPEVIDAVIEATPETEWKVLISLSRYGGLRCPSEHLALQWQDVDWERNRLHVRSPKTEHHEGGGSRVIPLFPEVRTHLLKLFEESPEGAVHVISRTRSGAVNLRTHFCRLIRRAGFQPWPKLWHNLRASRETELMQKYDLATACRWIGNSPEVAAKHYAMSVDLDSDFKRATQADETPTKKPPQIPPQQTAARGVIDGKAKELRGPDSCVFAGDFASFPSDYFPLTDTGWAIQESNL